MEFTSTDGHQFESLLGSFVLEDTMHANVRDTLALFLEKLAASARSTVRRCRDRALDEAAHTLKQLLLIHSLESNLHQRLVRILLTLQMEMNTASACRKIDQMLQCLAQFNPAFVFNEFQQSIERILHQTQIMSLKDLHLDEKYVVYPKIVCMFLEESMTGQDVLREACISLLSKVAELISDIMKKEERENGPLCYQAVKVCLQVFQLLPDQVSQLVFDDQGDKLAMWTILKFLMNIILGEVSNRDTRLLAGTAVAMLISTAKDRRSGGSSAWSLLLVTSREQCRFTVGGLQVDCCPRDSDGVDRLSVVRGLLTCCRRDVLLSCHSTKGCLLLDGLFPLVSDLRKETADNLYYVFQVFTMWLRSVKECLPEIWDVTGTPFFGGGSNLLHDLIQIIWDNAESPVDGVTESVHTAFCLLLEIYELDCQHHGDKEKQLYVELLQRISDLPWECKAKYSPLSALLPYVGTNKVLEQYPTLPSHILKCLSTNHLSPSASEVYKALLQQQRRELTIGLENKSPPTELHLANRWANRWQSTVLKALTSDVTLLQNNTSSYLLPCTLRCFPGAFETLLPALNPSSPRHLRAWAYIMSAQRSTSGGAPWNSDGSAALETLQLALSALDTDVRLSALSLICCSPKTREAPTQVEFSIMRDFLPLNLNSESSPFRQHLQTWVRKFLVRVRDSCLASLKVQKSKKGLSQEEERELEEGVDFVDWLSQLPLSSLAPGNSFQRKRTALLLLGAVLETCSDSWTPERKKGQPPANMVALINWARKRGKWDFFSRSRQLVLIGCLEDSTNEIREHAAELLVKFFPSSLPADVAAVLFNRAQTLLQRPRVQEAQMGALVVKLLLQKCVSLDGVVVGGVAQEESASARLIRHLLKSLEQQYHAAKEDMLHAARSSPLHGVVNALQRCLLEVPGALTEAVDCRVAVEIVSLLEKITQLLLGVLYGDQQLEDKEVPPSFCDMGNAISSLIGQGGAGMVEEEEETVLLSEEHSLVLTCCWVSLKEIGIFLGSLVERILSLTCNDTTLLTVEELQRASKVFKNIILKCRHWGAVEGCCIGFTRFCSALLMSSEPLHREIPAHILRQGLSVLKSPCSTSVTRRAAGLPMLILGVLAAEESSSSRPLLAYTMNTLIGTARAPLDQDWDQTLDLSQVCAVHTLQALVKGSSLGLSVLQYVPEVAMLSLMLLSSPCWSMRNAALQLYSSLFSRMLGQRPAGEDVSAQYAMSPPAFFSHYPALQPFLLAALESAAADLHKAGLSLHPSLYPVLTLLAKLQPGSPEQTRALSDFLPPLLQLAASPVYSIRVMSSRALVAMIPPTEYLASVLQLVGELPKSPTGLSCHNRVHGQLLQIKAILARALHADDPVPSSLCGVVEALEARLWLVSTAQQCPLVRQAYMGVLKLLRKSCSGPFLTRMGSLLLEEIRRTPHALELGSASLHQCIVNFLCEDPEWVGQVFQNLSSGSAAVRLSLVKWVKEGRCWRGTGLQSVMERELQANLKEALLEQNVEYKSAYFTALVEVMAANMRSQTQDQPVLSGFEASELQDCVEFLMEDVEKGRGGPELLSKALCVLSLLLFQSLDLALLQRWCVLLETHRCPEGPEVLRMACAQALGLIGAAVVTRSFQSCPTLKSLSMRLISTGIHLLQDESQQVRDTAAVFASHLCQPRLSVAHQHCLMQNNQSLHSLLELLLRELWDSEGTLEALMCQLPECNLRNILHEAKLTQHSCLYEQDEANVFLEPSVICETVMPHMLHLAKHYPESSSLAIHLDEWAQQSAAFIRENLDVCMSLQIGDALDPDWLSLLTEPRFHASLCGLYTRATFLLQLLRVSDNLQPLLNPLTLAEDLLVLHSRLSHHGVFLPNTFINSVKSI